MRNQHSMGMSGLLLMPIFILIIGCGDGPTPGSQPTDTTETVEPVAELLLDGQPNFRDLGGLETTDGKALRSRMIFRSGELSHISENDLKKLESAGILKVINFLTPKEIEKNGEDIVPEGTEHVYIPIDADGWAHEAQNAIRNAEFDKISPDINPMFHEMLVDVGREPYAAFLRSLIEGNGEPTVYHCSHGVHRTGTATAILLGVLGVPWEDIRTDYLRTNEARKDEVEQSLVKLNKMAAEKQGIPVDSVDMTNINAFYILEGRYIDATQAAVMNKYGSFEDYAIKGLGLDQTEVEKLRSIYLVDLD